MFISDDNTLEDIFGEILVLQDDLPSGQSEYSFEKQFEKIIARIDMKIAKNQNKIRGNWFNISREHAVNALTAFKNGDVVQAENELSKTREYLEQGNKAHKRKATFVVSPEGTAYPTENTNTAQQDAAANP